MVYKTHSVEETEKVGYSLGRLLSDKGKKRAFIAMRGEMGVGKTAFTRGFAAYFDISGVRSPTYTVVNEYQGKCRIYHFDMYRISDGDDLYSIGYDDYVESEGYCIAEWSENIADYLPEDTITVTISRCGEDTDGREIVIDYENSGI